MTAFVFSGGARRAQVSTAIPMPIIRTAWVVKSGMFVPLATSCTIAMPQKNPNSRLPLANSAECWLHCLVCPRRYRANLPSHLRPNLFGSD